MLIKNTQIDFQWQKKIGSVFVLLGQDCLQLNNVAASILSRWTTSHENEVDKKIISIMDAQDWSQVAEEACSLSLFADTVLLDIRYDKKTLDASGKKFLQAYIENPKAHCLLLIRAPQLPVKQIQGLLDLPVAQERLQVILSTTPNATAIQYWISQKLQAHHRHFDKGIPALIYQYTEGNLLATAQVLEKLALSHTNEEPLIEADLRLQLEQQSTYSLYALAEFCLSGDMLRAVTFLRQARENKTDPILVLWLLAQEIRTLMQLAESGEGETKPFQDKARELKIWSQRVKLYQAALERVHLSQLKSLLISCSSLDLNLKIGKLKPARLWINLESIALSLCTGKEFAHVA